MFAPDLSRYPWGRALAEAAQRGPEAVAQVAAVARMGVDDDLADEFGAEIAELLHLRIDPPGHIGSLVAAATKFRGPRTVAVTGAALRDGECAAWKVERGLEILGAHRGPEAVIQSLLCGREATEVAALERARAQYRGYPRALAELLSFGDVDAPARDLHRYFELGLEQAMIQGTRFEARALRDALTTPARDALGQVVWASYTGRRAVDVFICDPDGDGFIDDAFEPVELDEAQSIGVVHPVELSAELREQWGAFLGDLEIAAPFSQFDRERPEADQDFGYRKLDVVVKHWALTRFLFARGWTREYRSPTYSFPIRGNTLGLTTTLLDDQEHRRLDRLWLGERSARSGLEDEVVRTEAVAESYAVLEQFAPEQLFS